MTVPFFILIPYAVFLGIYLIGFLLVYSSGTQTYPNGYCTITLSDEQKYYLWYWTFMFLWFFAFLDALTQFVLASTVAIWYFSQENCHKPVTRSFYRAFRYHLGSIAFGSLLVAIVQIVRLYLYYI